MAVASRTYVGKQIVAQNTGTNSAVFQLDSENSGIKLNSDTANGVLQIFAADGSTALKIAVADPTADAHAATKKFVVDGYQPLDGQLTDIAGLTPSNGYFIVGDGTNFVTESGSTALTSLGAAASDDSRFPTADEKAALAGNYTPNAGNPYVTVQELTALAQGTEWQDSVISIYDNDGEDLPATPTAGNRYLAGATAKGWTKDHIYEYNGTSWVDAYTPTMGSAVFVDAAVQAYIFNSSNAWVKMASAIAHDTLGGLAGGTTDEYFHLTSAQHSALGYIAAVTPTDGVFLVGDGTQFVGESGSTALASLGLGSIATQDADDVSVTGGAINGTAIGGTTAAAGTFTDLVVNTTAKLPGAAPETPAANQVWVDGSALKFYNGTSTITLSQSSDQSGTSSDTFQIGTSGPILTNTSGVLSVTNAAGTAAAPVNVSVVKSIKTVTTATTVTISDDIILVDTTAGAVTITLPAASTVLGKTFEIYQTAGANAVTVALNAADKFDNDTSTSASLLVAADFIEVVALATGNVQCKSLVGVLN